MPSIRVGVSNDGSSIVHKKEKVQQLYFNSKRTEV
jgi:hypothetical protein